jgi:DNA damage-binding protein 1
VSHSILCQFTGSNDRNLVIAKGNRVEIFTIVDDSLTSPQEFIIHGKVGSMVYYRPQNHSQDLILILTERKHFSLISYDCIEKKILTRATGNLKDRIGRECENGIKAQIDPECRLICMTLNEGVYKVKVR